MCTSTVPGSFSSVLKTFALVSTAAFGVAEIAVKYGTTAFIEDSPSAAPPIADSADHAGVVRNGLVGFYLLYHFLPCRFDASFLVWGLN
jgi:hypothetical protein